MIVNLFMKKEKEKMNERMINQKEKIDWIITLVPLFLIIALCVLFFFMPEQSNKVLSQIRFFSGDTNDKKENCNTADNMYKYNAVRKCLCFCG